MCFTRKWWDEILSDDIIHLWDFIPLGRGEMVESGDSLPTASRRVTWSRSSGFNRALSLPVVYDFDSEDEENVYPEETSELVLPLCAKFDSITREEANR